jgi:hypothetical protein
MRDVGKLAIASFIIRYPGWQARVHYVVYRDRFHCEVHATFSEPRVFAISPFLAHSRIADETETLGRGVPEPD